MTNKKYLNTFLATTVAVSMISPQMVSANAVEFDDISSSYAKENIEYLAFKGIVGGVTKNKFAPKTVMNREAFAALLGKTLQLEEKSGGSSYHDVSPWAQGIVGALEAENLVAGLGENYFGAKMPVTREQMAVFYVRALGFEKEANALNLPLKYTDANDVAEWAKPLVAFAEQIGFIKGYPDGSFKPKKEALREDVAALSYRFIDPENTDPIFTGGERKENRYIKEAKKLIESQQTTLTIDSGDITATNVANYIVKGKGEKGREAQVSISYERENDVFRSISKKVTVNENGNYEIAFDLTQVSDGPITITVEYWISGNSKPGKVEKTVQKKVNNADDPKDAVIESVKALEDVVVIKGETPNLPTNVTVVLSNKEEKTVPVTWDTKNLNIEQTGTYRLKGVVAGTDKEATLNVIVKVNLPAIDEVRIMNPETIRVTLDRTLETGEELLMSLGGTSIQPKDYKIEGTVLTITVPEMDKGKEYELHIQTKDGVDIYKEMLHVDLKIPGAIQTVPVGYAKQVGEKVQVRYVVLDEENNLLEGARVRIQVQYDDPSSLAIKVDEAVVVSDENGEVTYEYTSLDARRDVVNAIAVDNPANARNEGNITVDWSFAKTGLIEVDVPHDSDLGAGTYHKYTVAFKDENGNPLPKNTKVYVYLGEQASTTTRIKPGTDFTKVLADTQYAEATIDNFKGQVVLEVTDIAGKTVKPLFYYDLGNDSIVSYKPYPNDPRVQAGATMYKKQIPNFVLEEKKQGKIPVGDTRTVQLTATDQFGDPYLGIVRVGLEQAMDNLNETEYGHINFDIDINRDGDADDAAIGEFKNQTGKAASEAFQPGVVINFGDRIKDGHMDRSIVDFIVKDGLHLEEADFVAFVDETNNGYDASDYQKKTHVEFEDAVIKSIDISSTSTKITEGNTSYFTVGFKDQNGKPIAFDASNASDIAFQVLDEAGHVIADYNDPRNEIALETDYNAFTTNTATFTDGVDHGHTLSYTPVGSYEKFVVKFKSTKTGNYTLRVFLDQNKPTPDQKKQDDEIGQSVSMEVVGPVLTSGEIKASSKYSFDKTKETFAYTLRDQDRQNYKATEDLMVQFSITNTGTTAATITDEDNRNYVVSAGQTIEITEKIEKADHDYVLQATPNAKGSVTLRVQAQIKNVPTSASTSEITWASVKIDETGVSGPTEKIYTGKVVSFKRASQAGTDKGWYIITTSVGNVKIEFEKGVDGFIVDQNTDDTGLAFDEQITIGDEISWEYDGTSEKHKLTNK